MKKPLICNIKVPLFVRNAYKDIFNDFVSDMSFVEAIENGFVRVYDNPNCMPVDIVGPITKIQFNNRSIEDCIEFNVYDTKSGKFIKSMLDMNCYIYSVPIFELNRYKGNPTNLIGFGVFTVNENISVDVEYDNFILTKVIRRKT